MQYTLQIKILSSALTKQAGAETISSHVLFWKELLLTIACNSVAYAILDRFHGVTVNSIPK
jgi:hypothetical protein